tara:strand:- start:1477 stop:2991 length:1515 start_codon:yes stop_codon:yes gene_type:complete
MKKFLLSLTIFLGCKIQPLNDQLNLVLPGDPRSLDPILATDVRSGQICALLYDNLVHYGDSVEIIPGIAKKWDISNNGKKYTFKLNTKVYFNDGKKVKSEDVVKSFLRIIEPSSISPFFWIFENVVGAKEYKQGRKKNIEGFAAPDDSTIVIKLIQSQNSFINFLAMPPTSIVSVNEGKKLIGSGPWFLTERIFDGHMLFHKNKNYFNGEPLLSKIQISIIPETFTRIAKYISGFLDIMEIPKNEYQHWKKKKEFNEHIYYQNELNTYYIGLNCERYPFNNKKIRQAVNYAINKKEIIKKILNGNAIESKGPIPPKLMSFKTNHVYNYNIDKANQLLKEVNIKQKIEVELWQSKSQKNSLITEIIQSQLEKINISVKIIKRDWNTFTQAIRNGETDMYYRSWHADYPDAENFIEPLFFSNISKIRWNRYENKNVDRLIDRTKKENDNIKRNKNILEANNIIVDDAPWIFLWHTQTPFIVNPKLKDWKPKVMYNAEKYLKVKKND